MTETDGAKRETRRAERETRRAERGTRGAGSLLRGRPFRRYWAAQSISFAGDEITTIALPLLAVGLGATPAELGLIVAARWLPSLLFAVPAGAWADRLARRRHVMIATDLGRAVLLASVPAAVLLGDTGTAHLVGVAFGIGLLSVLFTVNNAGLLPALVPPARYVDGNSLVNGSRALAGVAGPGAGGVLVQLLSAPVALLADACTYLWSALLLARISPAEPPAASAGGGSRAGLRHVLRSPVLAPSLVATAIVNLAAAAIGALFVLYASTTLGLQPWQIGLALGVGAVGGLVGAALAGPVSRRIGVGPTFVVGCALFPASMLLIPLADGSAATAITVLVLSEFGQGVGVMGLDVAGAAILTALAPPDQRSSVFGAYQTVNFGVRPLGALAGGGLATLVGVRPTLWIAAAIGTTGFLWLLRRPVLQLREVS